MEIYIEAIPLKVSLAAWESIHMKFTKYDDKAAAEIAGLSNFEIAETFTDSKDYKIMCLREWAVSRLFLFILKKLFKRNGFV